MSLFIISMHIELWEGTELEEKIMMSKVKTSEEVP